MTCDSTALVTCDGVDLVSVEPNLEDQGGVIGGAIVCRDIAGTVGVALRAASEQFGGTTFLIRDGSIQMVNATGKFRLMLADGDPEAGQDGGLITLTSSTDVTSPMPAGGAPPSAITLNASERSLRMRQPNGTEVLALSAADADSLVIHDTKGSSVLTFRRDSGALNLGGPGTPGGIGLRDKSGNDRVKLSGRTGEIIVRGLDAGDRIQLLGALSQIVLKDADHQTTVLLDGVKGDIVVTNADCAENFDVVTDGVEPGTVMVISDSGALDVSKEPYDSRVAGVPNRRPLALVGKVFCKVDATRLPVKVGSLLTTSDVAGHAMCASDRELSFGAVLGKALAPMRRGRGLIPILVTLQ